MRFCGARRIDPALIEGILTWSIIGVSTSGRRSSHRPLSSLSTEIRIAQLIYYERALSYRRIPSRSLLFGPCRIESARWSAVGLKITIDADLLPRYLVPRDSRFAKIPRIYIPARQCRRIDLPLCVLQCNGSQSDASYLSATYFVRSRNVRLLTFLTTLHGNTLSGIN